METTAPGIPEYRDTDELTPAEASAFLRTLTVSTLKKMRSRSYKSGPDYVKRNGRVLYPFAALRAWKVAHTESSRPSL